MSKIALSLTVNGEPRQLLAEPREQLADVLRRELMLTGTHVGCEHGVCGACTVEIDGAPARSCIAHAGSCDGASIRTIEGFGDDGVMAALREAFSREHALQCGYCTPGMLVTARDIVLRLPDVAEWTEAVQRMRNAGFAPVAAFNPYWDHNGVTFEDPDGYRVVLQNAAWAL